jgi:uncharacterized protein YndB with AHSA1/START domain
MAAHVFRFEEGWDIPGAGVEEVYDVLAHGELLPLWWKGVYLEARKLTDDAEPRVGAQLAAKVRGFLPFTLDFTIEATELSPPHRVAVTTRGDLDGAWSATLAQQGDGVRADLVFEVAIARPGMRVFAPLLRPLFALNHYWTTPKGEKGLREFVAARRRIATASSRE